MVVEKSLLKRRAFVLAQNSEATCMAKPEITAEGERRLVLSPLIHKKNVVNEKLIYYLN